jgi:hypothetical protein
VGLVLSLVVLTAGPAGAAAQREGQREVAARDPAVRYPDLGPEMQAYMGFLDAEEAELKHLFDVGEVPPSDFRLSRDRLLATREAALRVERPRGDDIVPDLYILVESELTQVLPEGAAALRGKRSGAKVDDNYTFHGTIRRGELFYVLERTGGIGSTAPE